MKNIHLLPTDKPSKLQRCGLSEWFVINKESLIDDRYKWQNIYITNNEKIKEGDWFLNTLNNKLDKCDDLIYEKNVNLSNWCKKIILTTDQDLIEDGVQAIDDEFLEWFCKNPSCEYVDQRLIWDEEKLTSIYKIIIPKKEPKQDLEKEIFELEQELDIPSHLRWHNSKPKQKTLEEAAEEFVNNTRLLNHKVFFMEGAKWQQEKIFEIMDLYIDDVISGCTLRAKDWFEKNKIK